MRRPLVLCLLGAACASAAPAPEVAAPAPPVRLARAHASSTDATPRAEGAAEPAPAFRIEPAIVEALRTIDAAGFRRDLASIVGPRNDLTDPGHLAEVIRTMGAALARAGFTIALAPVQYGGRTGHNLVAERTGLEPGRVVALTAHLDTVPGSPGADDDGSGLAALLGVARATRGVRTGATLRIVAFGFEEDGTVGSARYVEGLAPAARAELAGVINMDMIAYRAREPGTQRYPAGIERLAPGRALPTAGDFIGAVGLVGEPILPAMEHARQYCSDLRAETVEVRRLHLFGAPDLMRGDHGPFWIAGIPAVSVGDTGDFRNPHYHAPSDVLESVDPEFGAAVTRWVAASALTLAGVR